MRSGWVRKYIPCGYRGTPARLVVLQHKEELRASRREVSQHPDAPPPILGEPLSDGYQAAH
jgi:hypothetical protein